MDERRRSGSDELRALLHLRALPGIGDLKLAALLERFGSARAALDAPAAALGAAAARVRGTRPILARVDRALRVLDREPVLLLTRDDPRYPAALRALHDPPCVLFARGRMELLERASVAIVGSRRATPYGIEVAGVLAGELARAGVVVISGMARGIDAAAHGAALDGGTIGVLGCGIDVAYPFELARLYRRVAEDGLLLTEFLPGERPLPHHFPRRNRIIAALARGVLVVEAARRSGALITVDHALDLGKDICAVPGPIGRPASEGTNELIRDGAHLVVSGRDIVEALKIAGPSVAGDETATSGAPDAPGTLETPGTPGMPRASGPSATPVTPAARATAAPRGTERATAEPTAPPGLAGDRLALWRMLDFEPQTVDRLAQRSGLAAARTLAALLELEVDGHARHLPGPRFVKA